MTAKKRTEAAPKKTGRPSSRTPERVAAICARLAEGESLRSICRDEGMPSKITVLRWLDADESFRAQYAQAREQGFDAMADQLLEIADDATRDTVDTEQGPRMDAEWVARSRLRVDARKWLLSKLAPKKYGERAQVDVTNSDGSLQLDETARAARLAQLLAKAQERKAADGGDEGCDLA